jgi:hypothetical protein
MHLSIGEKHIVPRRRVAALRLKISSSLREEARRRVKVVLEETEAVEWVLWSGAEVWCPLIHSSKIPHFLFFAPQQGTQFMRMRDWKK